MRAINISKDTIIELYTNQKMTIDEMCIKTGIKSRQTMIKYMRKNGIDSRDTNYESSLMSRLNISEEELFNKLKNMYLVEKISTREISKRLNVSQRIITKYLKKCNVRVMGREEANSYFLTGPNSSNWKGGKSIQNGYVYVYNPDHLSISGKYMYEHRLVVENSIGRRLRKDEIVHHINGNKVDNRIENLEILNSSEHAKKHALTHVPLMNKMRLEKFRVRRSI